MSLPLADDYDRALAELFGRDGYARFRRGLYARSDNDAIWQGLWLHFHRKHGRLCAEPTLTIYCPAAAKITSRGLVQLYGPRARSRPTKLGSPLVTHPLYDLVRRRGNAERYNFSYDVATFDDVADATDMIHSDFGDVAEDFFGDLSSFEKLRDRIATRPTSTGSAIDVMVLGFLLNPKLRSTDIDIFARIRPSPMTSEFAVWLKAWIAEG